MTNPQKWAIIVICGILGIMAMCSIQDTINPDKRTSDQKAQEKVLSLYEDCIGRNMYSDISKCEGIKQQISAKAVEKEQHYSETIYVLDKGEIKNLPFCALVSDWSKDVICYDWAYWDNNRGISIFNIESK